MFFQKLNATFIILIIKLAFSPIMYFNILLSIVFFLNNERMDINEKKTICREQNVD